MWWYQNELCTWMITDDFFFWSGITDELNHAISIFVNVVEYHSSLMMRPFVSFLCKIYESHCMISFSISVTIVWDYCFLRRFPEVFRFGHFSWPPYHSLFPSVYQQLMPSQRNEWRGPYRLLFCSSKGDKAGVMEELVKGVSANLADYDKRTALHLASCEGCTEIVNSPSWQRSWYEFVRSLGSNCECKPHITAVKFHL